MLWFGSKCVLTVPQQCGITYSVLDLVRLIKGGSEMGRKHLVVTVTAVALVGIVAVQWYFFQSSADGKKQLLSIIRDTSANVFYPVFMVFALLVLGPMLYLLINQKKWSRIATMGNVYSAKKVALSLWRVDGDPMVGKDFAVLCFTHMSWRNYFFVLPVRPGHPDIEQFRQLKNNDTVEFDALSEGMECALEYELCGYLRIKEVVKPT